MSYLSRAGSRDGREAEEPLFRDSDEDHEKRNQDEGDASGEKRALQASIRRLRAWLIAVSVVLGISCLYTLYSFRGSIQDRKASKQLAFAPPSMPSPESIRSGSRLTNLPVPTEIVKFEQHEIYASPSTSQADEAWGALNPPGDGFVLIPNYADFSLPPGKPTEQGDVYDISVFHQLHCLNHIRTFLFTLKAGMDHNNTRVVYDRLLRGSGEDHVYHCFDYIRQALMCHADLTVEWPRTEEDGRRFAVDGWGISHQCKNWVSDGFDGRVWG